MVRAGVEESRTIVTEDDRLAQIEVRLRRVEELAGGLEQHLDVVDHHEANEDRSLGGLADRVARLEETVTTLEQLLAELAGRRSVLERLAAKVRDLPHLLNHWLRR
jgi:chromosome segregation ATPase